MTNEQEQYQSRDLQIERLLLVLERIAIALEMRVYPVYIGATAPTNPVYPPYPPVYPSSPPLPHFITPYPPTTVPSVPSPSWTTKSGMTGPLMTYNGPTNEPVSQADGQAESGFDPGDIPF